MQRLILTRSSEDNYRLVKTIIKQGCKLCTRPNLVQLPSKIIESTLLNVEPVVFNKEAAEGCIAKAGAVVLSSRNAVYALKDICFKDKLFYVIGAATAQELKAAGFENIDYIARDMADLISFLKKAYKLPTNFCYLRGIHITFDFAGWCKENGFYYQEVQVYDSIPAIEFTSVLTDFMCGDEPASVVFFSRRAAQSFINITVAHGFMHRINAIKALCISASVLESVEQVFKSRAYAALSPDLRGISELVLAHMEED